MTVAGFYISVVVVAGLFESGLALMPMVEFLMYAIEFTSLRIDLGCQFGFT